ncbi:hypothetical protein ACN94T_002591 [Acinetobacter baumannii]|nr:hypothetical protein [Acinetobacter baumannii]EKX9959441.1 hypothetical protein [Acinetobacter baumannii]EKY0928458.1 hypothetical protein [Acinetobacter baumannii]EKY1173503.1 hypothetical protein [Acinetobacter baumannii]HCW3947881.1 hypothetical protein [Acinetobacter baumannii]
MTISENALKFEVICKGKHVKYFGVTLYVPKGFKWVAMDQDGTIYAYTHKPRAQHETFALPAGLWEGHTEIIGFANKYKGNWRKSRIKVNHLPKVKSYVRT